MRGRAASRAHGPSVPVILHSKPWISRSDIESLAATLRGGMLAQGETTALFERRLADWFGTESPGVAAASGSAAIVMSLLALEVGSGDEVIVSSYNCSKVLEAVLTVGAVPVLADMGEHWMCDADKVRPLVSRRTKAIVIPHLLGIFSPVRDFLGWGVAVIEDCAQAIGAMGAHRIQGDIAIFSFHPTKLITTGEGGMAITPRRELADRMRRIRDGEGGWRSGRLFAPMSDLAAALGVNQLERYPEILKRRRGFGLRYLDALKRVVPQAVANFPIERSMFFRLPLDLEGGTDRYQDAFLQRGVRVSRGVDALLHRARNLPDATFEQSVRLFDRTLCLPIYPALSEAEFDHCVAAATALLRDAPG